MAVIVILPHSDEGDIGKTHPTLVMDKARAHVIKDLKYNQYKKRKRE